MVEPTMKILYWATKQYAAPEIHSEKVHNPVVYMND